MKRGYRVPGEKPTMYPKAPTQYFVRVFTVDPEGIDADAEEDFDAYGLESAELLLASLREKDKRAALMERVNIRPDRHHDGFVMGYDFEEKVLRDAHE